MKIEKVDANSSVMKKPTVMKLTTLTHPSNQQRYMDGEVCLWLSLYWTNKGTKQRLNFSQHKTAVRSQSMDRAITQ